MGLLSRFENKMDDGIQGAAGLVGRSGLSPIQITKKAEKQMRREKIVGAGKQYAPTLYTVLVSPEDDEKLFKFYPTLAGETETYLMARAREYGYVMDGHPLVRFLADPELKRGKFDVVAEVVASHIIVKLRDDEMRRYGLPTRSNFQASPLIEEPEARPEARAEAANDPRAAAARANAEMQAQVADEIPIMEAEDQDGIPGHEVVASQVDLAGVDDLELDDAVSMKFKGPERGPGVGAPDAIVEEREVEDVEVVGEHAKPRSAASEAQAAEGVAAAVVDQAVGEVGAKQPVADQAPNQAAVGQVVTKQPVADHAVAAQPAPTSHAAADVGAAQAANARPGELHVYLYDEARDTAYNLTGAIQTIGRESSNDIVVPDINISRVHAQICREPDGTWTITDLKSTNGMYVNGSKTRMAPLKDADMITMGTSTLEFQLLD